jgi:hypothetical protein
MARFAGYFVKTQVKLWVNAADQAIQAKLPV